MLTLFISLLLSFNNTKVRHFPLPGKLSKLYFSCHKVKYMLGLKKIILSFIIINQNGFPRTAKGLTGISCEKLHVNEIIIHPFKPQFFKGNDLSENLNYMLTFIKTGIKKNVTKVILVSFVTFHNNITGLPHISSLYRISDPGFTSLSGETKESVTSAFSAIKIIPWDTMPFNGFGSKFTNTLT